MPSKYEIISALASQEAVRITSDVAQYEAFLVILTGPTYHIVQSAKRIIVNMFSQKVML